MNDYNYVILFDENGQPYISHSFKSAYRKAKSGVKSAGKTAYKYLLKIGKGAKAQYAYTKEEVDRLLGRGRSAVKSAGAKVKDAADSAARSISPGYRARADWKKADLKVKEDKSDYDTAASTRAKLWNEAEKALKNRDQNVNSAYAQKHFDDSISAVRKEIEEDGVGTAYKKLNEESEKASALYRRYATTTLSKVEAFMKDPLTRTRWAIEDLVDTVETKVNDIKDSFNERRTQRREAKAEKAMQNDPKVMQARKDYSNADTAFTEARDAFLEYAQSSSAEKGSEKWKRLERDYQWAQSDLESAKTILDRREVKYRQWAARP